MVKPPTELTCDLLVTGAGIYGAWTAYDAALRGLKVLLVDQGDIANATSSSSSKLIHGGLRYLEQFNFSLVKKSVAERQLLFKLAPHRVQPLRFGVPVYKRSRVPAWKFKAGLWLYDWLANLKENKYLHQSLNSDDFSLRFPFLKKEDLKKGYTYVDARTDDARYTLEIVDGAVNCGADLKTYCRVQDYIYNKGKICGAHLTDVITGENFKVQARAVVNATGRYTDSLLGRDDCRLSKGVHLIMPSLKSEEALLLLSPVDGRVFFTIPWYGKTMVGTTDTDYGGPADSVEVTQEDISYLLKSANHYLGNNWQQEDIISSFAGLRVLKKGNSNHPSQKKREWMFNTSGNGLFISIGGKFTAAREDVSHLVDEICNYLGLTESCETSQRDFPWTPADFPLWEEKMLETGAKLLIREKHTKNLISRQGKRAETILNMIEVDSSLGESLFEGCCFTLAEWQFSIKNEYIRRLDDLLRRRFPIALINNPNQDLQQQLLNKANSFCKPLDIPQILS